MTATFQYSVLKYRHSIVTNETLNVGILFLLADGRLEFHYPSKLARISTVFASFPISFVRNTLATFNYTANKLSKNSDSNLFYYNDFKSLITKHFLTENSGSFFFSEVKKGFYPNLDTGGSIDEKGIKEYYYKLYLGEYEEETSLKKNERYILDTIRDIIKSYFSSELESKLKVNKVLHDPYGNFNEKFEYGWKNTKLNLITPIGFDLANDQSFEAKALRWNAILNFFKEPATIENINFDILLTEPKRKDLRGSFNKAVDIIEKSNAPIRFVKENNYKKYVKEAVDVVLDHDSRSN